MRRKLESGIALMPILGVGAVVLVCYFLYNAFDIGSKLTLHRAIRNIEQGRELVRARDSLRGLNDRQAVVEALKEALDDEDGTIHGKINILQTLSYFKENRIVRRAVDSKVLSTRRAAVWLRSGDPQMREQAVPVVLEWVRDTSADARERAVILCSKSRLNIVDAVPDLLKAIDRVPESQAEIEFTRQAMHVLKAFDPEGLAPKLLAIARNPDMHRNVRAEALDALSALENAPRDEVKSLLIAALTDRSATTLVRSKATNALRKPSYGSEEVWDALEKVLVDPKDDDIVTQRNCLNALGSSASLERLEKILLDRRVYRHPYFGIRIDVATALSALNVRKRIALEILCEYLVDDDPMDQQFLVRQEGWLSLFHLTGVSYGVREKNIFMRPPRHFENKEQARDYLWRASFMRPGFTRSHTQALAGVIGNLSEMQKIRQAFHNHLDKIVAQWKTEDEGQDAPDGPDKDDIEDAGPQPPPKKDDGG